MARRTSKARKAKKMEVKVAGRLRTVDVCPRWARLCVVKNSGARKGFLILRCEDGAQVAWARLVTHARQAMEKLEEATEGRELSEEDVVKVRKELGEL